ncbi:unnamed protein product [Caenorhabditis bovis]|uniref:Uncharacterized protein n=1 Tax=Caenorhabditis bovis TaxID=2654633 RepID=A0A8S1EH31_9PELO|nr:unnamed protein product [Caenorhabditis bovis]
MASSPSKNTPTGASPAGIFESARHFFSFALIAPSTDLINKKDIFAQFKFLTSPDRVKAASKLDADSFYMYGCGSINLP